MIVIAPRETAKTIPWSIVALLNSVSAGSNERLILKLSENDISEI
jgi:hypothetical protein